MLDRIKGFVTFFIGNRRGLIALIPAVVFLSSAFGMPIAEEMLNNTYDQGMAVVTSVLALWSLLRPQKAK